MVTKEVTCTLIEIGNDRRAVIIINGEVKSTAPIRWVNYKRRSFGVGSDTYWF